MTTAEEEALWLAEERVMRAWTRLAAVREMQKELINHRVSTTMHAALQAWNDRAFTEWLKAVVALEEAGA